MKKIPNGKPVKKSLLNRLFIRVIRIFKWLIIKSSIYRKILKKKYPINMPGNILWVNPAIIKKITYNYKKENPREKLSSVEDGDWDIEVDNFENLKIYNALKAYLINNTSLKDTDFYNPNIRNKSDYENEKGSRIWEYISEYEFDKRIKKINTLANSIKTKGYLSQSQMGGNPLDEIIVKIGRNGEILFFDGIHRLSIAKILKIDKIPVIVKTRHEKWIKLKEELYSYARMRRLGTIHDGKLYQKFAHPDLQDIPYAHDNTDRFNAIKNNLLTTKGKLLDIGANSGFFSTKFTELGFSCTAVELDFRLIYFIKKTNNIEKTTLKIEHQNILTMFDKPVEFDVVLALNIFHHFLKTENSYNKFIKLLKNLRMTEMFFEPHNPGEKQFSNAYKNLNNIHFIELIISNTNLNHYEKILDCDENRYLYHIWK